MYEIETFPVGSFQCNCSIVVESETGRAMIVDPGDEPDAILDRLGDRKILVTDLWHTHAHIDHVGATQALLEAFTARNGESGAPPPNVWLHEGDRWLYENIALQAGFLGLKPFEVPSTFKAIQDGASYAGLPGLRAIHTPGHTPGSCCLEIGSECQVEVSRSLRGSSGESSPTRALVSGDTLFRRSIGRTDLWGGDSERILRSIRNRLLKLKPETLVIPGHGPLTSIAEEAEKNPFLKER